MSLNLTSIGLTGYRFITHIFLQATILPVWKNEVLGQWVIQFTVKKEGLVPVSSLNKAEALVDGNVSITDYTFRYNQTVGGSVYEMYHSSKPSSIQLTIVDNRAIRVNATLFNP